MTATDDAREALAAHDGCSEDGDCPSPCPTGRLARTLLALTGEQAVEAAARAHAEGLNLHWPGLREPLRESYRRSARVALTAALAAAEETR